MWAHKCREEFLKAGTFAYDEAAWNRQEKWREAKNNAQRMVSLLRQAMSQLEWERKQK